MTITWSMRTLGLLALAAVAAAIATGAAAARPDPEGLRGASLADSGHATGIQLRRPTGPAEHTILGSPSVASETGEVGATGPGRLGGPSATKDGFDYFAAGIGALAAAAAFGLAAGAMSTHRRRSRVGATA